MNVRYTNQVFLLGLAAVLLLPAQDIPRSRAVLSELPDGISGSWSDACPCSTPCPCWRTGKANVPHCLNVQVYQPDTSNFSGRKPAFVLIGNSEGYRAPSQYVLYVDDSAEAAVARSMTNFLQNVYVLDSPDARSVT